MEISRRPNRFLCKIILLSLLLLSLSGCVSYKKPEFYGKVVDRQSGEPLKNARVEVAYMAGYETFDFSFQYFGLVSKVVLVGKVLVRTGEDGSFRIPRLSGRAFRATDKWVYFSVEKSGYIGMDDMKGEMCLSLGCEEPLVYINYHHDKKEVVISSHLIALEKDPAALLTPPQQLGVLIEERIEMINGQEQKMQIRMVAPPGIIKSRAISNPSDP